jgi:DNA-directed RNA polymerase subunit N (RpoN/RPB10)
MILASKYRRYQEIINSEDKDIMIEPVQPLQEGKDETLTQKAFMELGIDRYCCRRHFITHIDLVDKI